jgi:hypothetical protein
LKRKFKAAIVVFAVLLVTGVGLFWADDSNAILVFPEVWSPYSPYGASYEFKVNDGQLTPTQNLNQVS